MSASKLPQKAARTLAQRAVHSSPASRATAAIPTDACAALTLPPIFDIFDVPAGLHASGAFAREQTARSPPPRRSPSSPRPTLLPNALVFDGPAGRRPAVRSHHALAQPGHAAHLGAAVTLFDGPARQRQPRRPQPHLDLRARPPLDGIPSLRSALRWRWRRRWASCSHGEISLWSRPGRALMWSRSLE